MAPTVPSNRENTVPTDEYDADALRGTKDRPAGPVSPGKESRLARPFEPTGDLAPPGADPARAGGRISL